MTVKVSDVMRHVRNHFIHDALEGSWQLKDGVLTPSDSLKPGMWIAIPQPDTGDCPLPGGVYQLDEKGGIPLLGDMAWHGVIYRLSPPEDFLRLCGDISCWAAANPDPAVTQESLGAYDVSRRAVTWEEAFAPALAVWRRMFAEVKA